MEIDSTEWDEICRICLQEGELYSVFDFDDEKSEFNIAQKIMQCSSIEISSDGRLPEQICTECLTDLEVAYKFRKKCERSDAILQSFVDSSGDGIDTVEYTLAAECNEETAKDGKVVVSSESGLYEYKPPEGLNVKLIKNERSPIQPTSAPKKSLVQSKITNHTIFLNSEPADLSADETEYEEVYETIGFDDMDNMDSDTKLTDASDTRADLSKHSNNGGERTTTSSSDDSKLMQIKPVRTNKVRLGHTSTNKGKSTAVESAGATKSKIPASSKENLMSNRSNKTKPTASKEPKQPKKCEICGNTYMYQHALDSHMRRHRNEKPFVCSVCGKGFVINFELSRHMRTHTGQKPYACKFCDRRFSDFGSRVKHERIHTGERPYACEICGKTFAYSHVLSSHNLIHTGEKKYHCDICGKRFAKSHHLKAHLNTHNKSSAGKSHTSRSVTQHQSHSDEQLQDEVSEEAEQIYALLDDEQGNEDDYVDYLNDSNIIAKVSTSGTEDDGSEGEQMLLYDVDVLNSIKDPSVKRNVGAKCAQIITIAEPSDPMDLLEFEDDLE